MRTSLALSLVFLLGLTTAAAAQVTVRCGGETWAQLATTRFGRAELGRLIALYNRGGESETCTSGKFVRFPVTTLHELKLGQNLASVLSRFCSAPGAMKLVLEHNQLPAEIEPAPGTFVSIPAELALPVGSRPEAELAEIPGLPSLSAIRAYNGLAPDEALPAGGTLYVPLYIDSSEPKVTPPKLTPDVVPDTTPPESTRTSTPAPATSPAPTSAPVVVSVQGAVSLKDFVHGDHVGRLKGDYACGLCHVGDHAKPYAPIPIAVCTRCHSGVQETPGLRTQLLPLIFSHASHLSPTGKPTEAGYEFDCATCHPSTELEEPSSPDHATCIRCHNQVEHQPAVDGDCAGCHAEREDTGRLLLASALLAEHQELSAGGRVFRFTHGEHVRSLGPENAPTTETCDRCHEGVRHSKGLEDVEPLRMADCLGCHRGLKKEVAGVAERIDRCATCHLEDRTRVAPSHSTVVSRPNSHSPAFRVRHQAAAEADRGICQSCHPELSAGLGRECSACHLKIRPRDHSARFREEPHGRAALRQGADRCATCHARDRCADCHAQPPRDHFPASVFAVRHGNSARVSIRRCQTCHLPQVDCARCHDVSNL